MSLVELLEQCRGENTKQWLADQLGVTLRTVLYWYSGEKKPNRWGWQRMLLAFPGKRELIMHCFLSENAKDISQARSTVEPAMAGEEV